MKGGEKSEFFIKYMPKGLHYICKNVIVTVRQNAIMKEDGCYNTYTSNALFTPINMLGCLTLENPTCLEDSVNKIGGFFSTRK
jgi:hypothetical protein